MDVKIKEELTEQWNLHGCGYTEMSVSSNKDVTEIRSDQHYKTVATEENNSEHDEQELTRISEITCRNEEKQKHTYDKSEEGNNTVNAENKIEHTEQCSKTYSGRLRKRSSKQIYVQELSNDESQGSSDDNFIEDIEDYCISDIDSRNEDTKENVSETAPDHRVPKRFRCEICSSAFRKKYNLKRHVRLTHNVPYDPTRFKCSECASSFPWKHNLYQHKRLCHYKADKKVTIPRKFKCAKCYKVFGRKFSLKRHLLVIHNMQNKSKPKQNHCSTSVETSNEHENSDNVREQAELKGDPETTKHIEISNSETSNTNDRSVTQKSSYKSARGGFGEKQRIVKVKRVYYCHLCSRPFKVSQQLQNHIRSLHPSEKLPVIKSCQCDVCYQWFEEENSLLVHKQTQHLLEKSEKLQEKIKCDYCEALFSTHKYCERHMIIKHNVSYVNRKNTTCMFCSKEMPSVKLNFHFIMAHVDDINVCIVCLEKYNIIKNLQLSEQQKTKLMNSNAACTLCGSNDRTPYTSCWVCDVTMATTDWENHQLSWLHQCNQQTYMKALYRCEQCDEKFYIKSRLQRHEEKCHTNPERRYTCEECGIVCKSKTHLEDHLLMHKYLKREVKSECTSPRKHCNAECPEVTLPNSHKSLEEEFDLNGFIKQEDDNSNFIKYENRPTSANTSSNVTVKMEENNALVQKNDTSPRKPDHQNKFTIKDVSINLVQINVKNHIAKPCSDKKRLDSNVAGVNCISDYSHCNLCNVAMETTCKMHLHNVQYQNMQMCAFCSKFMQRSEKVEDHISEYHDVQIERFSICCQLCARVVMNYASSEKNLVIQVVPLNKVSGRSETREEEIMPEKMPFTLTSLWNREGMVCSRCTLCSYELNDWPSLVKHMSERHTDHIEEDKKWKHCNHCGIDVDGTKYVFKLMFYERPVECQIPTKTLNCPLCQKLCKDEYEVYTHCLFHMTPPFFSCAICPEPYRIILGMRKHSLTHNAPCTFCEEEFTNNNDKAKHMLICHPEKMKYRCDICSHGYNGKMQFQQHMLKHKSEKNKSESFKNCSLCSNYVANLNEHLKVCSGNQIIICEICGKKGKKAYMRKHKKIHNGDQERIAKCAICNNHIKYTMKNLEKHMEIYHSGKPLPFLCDICGAGFPQNAALQLHYDRHLGKKRFKCDLCPKAYYTQSGLKTHQYTHTGERPFKCPHCPKGFLTDANLQDHVRIHTGEKPYVCKFCKKAFTKSCNMKKHIKLMH